MGIGTSSLSQRSFSPYVLCPILVVTLLGFTIGYLLHPDEIVPRALGLTLMRLSSIGYRLWIVFEWARLVQDRSQDKAVMLLHLTLRILAFGASTPCVRLRSRDEIILVSFTREALSFTY